MVKGQIASLQNITALGVIFIFAVGLLSSTRFQMTQCIAQSLGDS